MALTSSTRCAAASSLRAALPHDWPHWQGPLRLEPLRGNLDWYQCGAIVDFCAGRSALTPARSAYTRSCTVRRVPDGHARAARAADPPVGTMAGRRVGVRRSETALARRVYMQLSKPAA